jgi:hypothetical protein
MSEATKRNTFLAVPVADWVKIGIGLMLGIGTMLFSNWWTSKAPFLRYTPADTVVFQGDKNRFGLVTCSVTNEGSKEAEDVEVFVDLADSPFVEVKASPETLQPVVKWENEPAVPAIGFYDPKEEAKKRDLPPPRRGNHAHVTVKLLNQGESLQVLAMASNPDKLPTRPEFTVRGKGVVGHIGGREALIATIQSVSIVFLVVSLAVSLWAFSGLLLTMYKSRNTVK